MWSRPQSSSASLPRSSHSPGSRSRASTSAGNQYEVLLGGGLMRAGDGRLLGAIDAGLREVGDQIVVHRTASPPIVGAALFGLDALGAGKEARERIRRGLATAVDSDEELGVTDGRDGDG